MVDFVLYGSEKKKSLEGLLLSSQCKTQPSHLEVTEWDLYRPALVILAVVFYMFMWGKKEAGRRGWGGFGCGPENQKEFWLLPHGFYENLKRMSLDSPLADQAFMASGYLWFPSQGETQI